MPNDCSVLESRDSSENRNPSDAAPMAACRLAVEGGCARLTWNVDPWNKNGQEFYRCALPCRPLPLAATACCDLELLPAEFSSSACRSLGARSAHGAEEMDGRMKLGRTEAAAMFMPKL